MSSVLAKSAVCTKDAAEVSEAVYSRVPSNTYFNDSLLYSQSMSAPEPGQPGQQPGCEVLDQFGNNFL